MEQETVITGYCRCLDSSRMVMAVAKNGQLTEVDCDYPGCPHAPGCPIAKGLDAFLEKS